MLPLVAILKVCIYTCSTHAHCTLGTHISEIFYSHHALIHSRHLILSVAVRVYIKRKHFGTVFYDVSYSHTHIFSDFNIFYVRLFVCFFVCVMTLPLLLVTFKEYRLSMHPVHCN